MTASLTPPKSVLQPATVAAPLPKRRGGGLYRITVAKYHKMLATGALKEGDPVELLEGKLVRKMGVNPPHLSTVRRLNKLLFKHVPTGWDHQTQGAITIVASHSEPEPDGAVFRDLGSELDTRHVVPSELGLVVEVSETTLRRDRGMKQRVYARESIPEYWIVNLVDSMVEVYTLPSGANMKPAYRRRQLYTRGTKVPLVLDGQPVAEVAVDDLLPAV